MNAPPPSPATISARRDAPPVPWTERIVARAVHFEPLNAGENAAAALVGPVGFLLAFYFNFQP